jgi:arsenate reductase
MAEGWAKKLNDGTWEARSAGSKPSGKINPEAVTVMREIGVDLTTQASKGLPDPGEGSWDYVVTMGCGDACPHLPAKNRVDWTLEDPKGKPLEFFRKTRDEIGRRVGLLMGVVSGAGAPKT